MTVTALPELLKPETVAELLGITPHTLAVWRCCKRYPLPYVKVGSTVRYRATDVAAFIANNLKDAA